MPPHQQVRGYPPGMRMRMPGQRPMAMPPALERPVNPMASENR